MKLLITGGAGFIGLAVIRHIIRHPADSVVTDAGVPVKAATAYGYGYYSYSYK